MRCAPPTNAEPVPGARGARSADRYRRYRRCSRLERRCSHGLQRPDLKLSSPRRTIARARHPINDPVADLFDQRHRYRYTLLEACAVCPPPSGPSSTVTQRQVLRKPRMGRGATARLTRWAATIPISSSKGCAELITSEYVRRAFIASAPARVSVWPTARAGNVIGGGDWANGPLGSRFYPRDHCRCGRKSGRSLPARDPPVAARPGAALPATFYLPQRCYAQTQAHAYADAGTSVRATKMPARWRMARRIPLQAVGRQMRRWILQIRPHPHEAGYLRLDIVEGARSVSVGAAVEPVATALTRDRRNGTGRFARAKTCARFRLALSQNTT